MGKRVAEAGFREDWVPHKSLMIEALIPGVLCLVQIGLFAFVFQFDSPKFLIYSNQSDQVFSLLTLGHECAQSCLEK